MQPSKYDAVKRKYEETHHIDMLKRKVGGLVEEEVHNDRTGQVARCEDKAVPELDILDDERGEECEEEVPYPVRARSEGRLIRPCTRRERLARENPDTGCPRHGIAQDEQTRRDDHEVANALVADGILRGTGSGEDEEPCGLPHTAQDERPPPAEMLHNVDAAECAAEVNTTENDLGDEGVRDADGLEDRRAVL